MRCHYGSPRFWLQQLTMLRLPYGMHPHNRSWKFSRSRDTQRLLSWIEDVRHTLNRLEAKIKETN